MTTAARTMIKGMLWLIGAYTVLMTAMILWIVWSLVIDTAPPITNMQARLLSYDAATRTALVRWSGIRHRFCEGETIPKIRDGIVVDLEPGIITGAGTADDQRMQATYPGTTDYPISWDRQIVIPPGVTGIARYVVTFRYACNTIQTMRPIVITPPDVEIPVGPDLSTDVPETEPGMG